MFTVPIYTLVVAVIVSVVIDGAVNDVNAPVLGVVAPMLMLLIEPSAAGANTIAPVELIVTGVVLITFRLVRVPTLVKLLLTIVEPSVVLFSNDTPPNNKELVSIDVLVIAPFSATENPGLVNPDCDSSGL
jgi:hypothetical protein